ncbi:MAG: hypothetical protein JWN46_1054 [Acidimicrobiales bacterium]|nr:hypothetical protein [Acidimicrobiales bacterium]
MPGLLDHVPRLLTAVTIVAAVTGVGLAEPSAAAVPTTSTVTSRVSVSSGGRQSDGGFAPKITPDGRYVVFEMAFPSFPGAGSFGQVYRRDLSTNTTVLVSRALDPNGVPDGASSNPSVSDDGRFVVFDSGATNLVAGDTGGHQDVFRRDVVANVTQRVSVATNGTAGNGDSQFATIDGAGTEIVFDSAATNLVALDTNQAYDVFVRHLAANTTDRVSVSTASAQGDSHSQFAMISGDGNWVVFMSQATNLVPGDTNAKFDVFVRSLKDSTTTRVSVKGATQGNGHSKEVSISGDGSKVSFNSDASNLVAGDTNGQQDSFVWTRSNGALTRVSTDSAGGQLAKGSRFSTALSRDGTVVAWSSEDANVTLPAGNGIGSNVYTTTLATSAMRLISANAAGQPGNGLTFRLSADQTGRRVAYDSASATLVRNDTNTSDDAFVSETGVSSAPFSDLSGFVTQQYKDFVGRSPTATELAEGVAQIRNGEQPPNLYIVNKAVAAPWAGSRAPVLRLYWAFFLREPDQGGYDYWLGQYSTGGGLAGIAEKFAQSAEFKSAYGPLSDREFVQRVYVNVLTRKADDAGVTYWVDQLQHHGLTRGGLMTKFSESPEGKRVLSPVTSTLLIHLGLIRKIPDKGLFDTWRTSPLPPSALVAFLRASVPYTSRFP